MKAAFEDMQSKGFVQNNAIFTGHSVGEYSAIAPVAGVLPVSSPVDVVFYRGITMQCTVGRDSASDSNYAMCAVNPSGISPSFNYSALREVANGISCKSSCLLKIVSFDVEVCSAFFSFGVWLFRRLVLGSTIRVRWRVGRSADDD